MGRLGRWFSQHILPLGAPGLFLLALIDSGLIPVPGGVDALLFAQVVRHPAGALLYAALAVVGSLLGCIFLYWISRKAGEVALSRRTSPQRADYIRRQIEKYEALTLVLPTMVPVPFMPMKLFVIAAGVFKVRFGLFVAAIAVARAIRFFGIALLARHYGGQTWTFIRENPLWIGMVVLIVLGAFFWYSRRVS